MPLDFESYLEPEVGVAAVVVAAVAAPSLRKVLRRSAVYGLAGVLIAYDKVAETTKAVVSRVRKGATATADTAAASVETAAETIPPLSVTEPAAK
jgi:hypothetical protein